MKIPIFISLFVNLILIAMLYNSKYFVRYFQDFESVEKSMALASELIEKETQESVKEGEFYWKRKAVFQIIRDNYLLCNSEKINCFLQKIKTYQSSIKEISNAEIIELINEHYSLIEQLRSDYVDILVLLKPIAKLREEHIQDYAQGADEKYFCRQHFFDLTKDNLINLPKKLLLESIINDLIYIQAQSTQSIIMLAINGYLGCSFQSYYPLVYAPQRVIRKNELFKAEIYWGSYSPNKGYKDRYTVYFDGKRLDYINLWKDKEIKVHATELGFHEHEFIIVYADLHQNIVHSDTSYLKYYVNP